MKRLFSGIFLAVFLMPLAAQEKKTNALSPADSLNFKLGQMIMVGINDRKTIESGDPLLQEIKSGKLGGIILFEKNISEQNAENTLKKMLGDLQSAAPFPLLVTIDEEGGHVHRLKPKYGFPAMPSAAYLGRMSGTDSTLYYNRQLAAVMANVGINLNFAPTVDLAINTKNKVIVQRERAFSGFPDQVSKHALACIDAHHEYGLKTILKHFPGHGSSTEDSHTGIVDVSNTWNFSELYPYHSILSSGKQDAVMTAHIINRRWDDKMIPATLSHKVVTGMLRNLLNYQGVVFSDDMQMDAIAKSYGLEKAVMMAVNAGVDVLLFGNNVRKDIKPISATEVHAILKKLLKENKITTKRVNESYARIMALKTKNVKPL